MTPETPRGFRDVLPGEAAWREAIEERVQSTLSSWGYMPIETPTLEISDVLDAGGSTTQASLSLFDSDGRLLELRPDVTLPIARMVASRLAGDEGPFRFRYTQKVFRESESFQAQSRETTQLGIECIGDEGVLADVEVITLLVEALEACDLSDFIVSVCSVGVLYALLDAANGDERWRNEVLDAYHASNFVALDEITSRSTVDPAIGHAIASLPRISGRLEAVARCRELISEFGCSEVLDPLERTWHLLEAAGVSDHVLIDFSVLSSFDYYTGMVMEAYAPGFGLPLGGGGRYDRMLEAFGRTAPAAGFAIYLENVMQALRLQGEQLRRRVPDVLIGSTRTCDEDTDAVCADILREAARLRESGLRVCITSSSDVGAEAERRGIQRAISVGEDGRVTEVASTPRSGRSSVSVEGGDR